MQNKKYIVRATADIAVTVETSTPENVKELLEGASWTCATYQQR